MKVIGLTQGKFATVDDEDFGRLSRYKWYARKVILKNRIVYYATRNTTISSGKQRPVQMHREIASAAGFPLVDHRDGDGLNNRRENIRPATSSQNQQNQRKRLGCSSRYKGVSWDVKIGKWRASIRHNRLRRHLGLFDIEVDAACAYDQAAKYVFGEFAFVNL